MLQTISPDFSHLSLQTPPEPLISSLPNELLVKIFKAGTSTGRWPATTSPRDLIAFCGVSQHWRMLAHNSPELWTKIYLPPAYVRRDGVVARTKEWIKRSKACLFDVDMYLSQWLDTRCIDNVRGILLVIRQHASRMRRLGIITDELVQTAMVQETLVPFRAVPALPFLEELDLCFFKRLALPVILDSERNVPFFHNTPRLSYLRLYGIYPMQSLPSLTTLEIDSLQTNLASFRELVRVSTLRHLVLRRLHPLSQSTDAIYASVVVDIPSLESLAVSWVETPSPSPSLLSMISTPNLECLELYGTGLPDLSTCFQSPSSLESVRTLRLTNIQGLSGNRLSRNASFFHSITGIRNLQLFHTSAANVLPTNAQVRMGRSRSIDLRDHTSRRLYNFPTLRNERGVDISSPNTTVANDSPSIWPQLQSITMDTIAVTDLLWLCELLTLRPQIESVNVSKSAARHLRGSLMIEDQKIVPRPSGYLESRFDWEERGGDVEEWLRGRVELKTIDTDGEHVDWKRGILPPSLPLPNST